MRRSATAATLLLVLLGSTAAAQQTKLEKIELCSPWPECLKTGPGKPPVINPGQPGDPSTPGIKQERPFAQPSVRGAPQLGMGR